MHIVQLDNMKYSKNIKKSIEHRPCQKNIFLTNVNIMRVY